MRKLMFCVCILLFCILIFARAESGEAARLLAESAIAVDGDTVYILHENGLWKADTAFHPSERIYEYDEPVCDIYCHGGEMYVAYRREDGIAFAVQKDGGLHLLFDVRDHESVMDFCVSDGYIAVIWGYSQQYGMEGLFNIYALQGTEVDTQWRQAKAVAVDDGGMFLIGTDDDGSYIDRFDPQSGNSEMVFSAEGSYSAGTIRGLTVFDGALYYSDYDGLRRILGDDESTIVYPTDNAEYLAASSNHIIGYAPYAPAANEVVQFAYAASDTQEKAVLHIVHDGDGHLSHRMNRAIEELRREYPNLDVKFELLPSESIKTVLMAGAEGADILFTRWNRDHYLIESGAFYDLRQAADLMTTLQPVAHLLPLTSYEGELYGVPLYVNANVLLRNESLSQYDTTGLNAKGCDWKEFLSAALEFNGDLNGDGTPELAYFMENTALPNWVQQYVSLNGGPESADLGTVEFREMAELYKQAVQQRKIVDIRDDQIMQEQALYRFEWVTEPEPYNENEWIALPMLNGKAANISTARALAVNARSQNLEIALRLLEIYESQMLAAEDADVLRQDFGDYLDEGAYTDAQRQRLNLQHEFLMQLTPNLMLTECDPLYDLRTWFEEEVSFDQWLSNFEQQVYYRMFG